MEERNERKREANSNNKKGKSNDTSVELKNKNNRKNKPKQVLVTTMRSVNEVPLPIFPPKLPNCSQRMGTTLIIWTNRKTRSRKRNAR